jgi:hypothetical protein
VCGTPCLKDMGERTGRAKIEQTRIGESCMQVKTEIKRRVGKGGSKKHKWGMNHLWIQSVKKNRLSMT